LRFYLRSSPRRGWLLVHTSVMFIASSVREIEDINTPEAVRMAMDRQAQAERTKRATVLDSEGHRDSGKIKPPNTIIFLYQSISN
jgi:hypothetical protein